MKTNTKSKGQIRREVYELRKKLMMGGPDLGSLSMKQLKKEAVTLQDFWVIETNTGPTIASKLIERGIELPDPDNIPENLINAKLWEVINGLAELYHFIRNTDHLSDRELYSDLWQNLLNDANKKMGPGCVYLGEDHDMVSTDSLDFFKYYADGYDMESYDIYYDGEPPKHEELPYNRDQELPTLQLAK